MVEVRNVTRLKYEITPVRLRLELTDDFLSDYEKRMLKRYGESLNGESIIRDILVPSDMPLHNLHYTIQRLFGWQNSHLRSFHLPKDVYDKLTGGTVKGWSDLVGVLFQPPSEAEGDIFWDDDYEKGSLRGWFRKKYTGPYIYLGTMEHPETAKRDVQNLLDRFQEIEVMESFQEYLEREKEDENAEPKIIKKAPLIDLTLEEMHSSLFLEGGTEDLLERLEVNKVLIAQGEKLSSTEIFPVASELIYNYDFGDDWTVKITKYKDCEDLLNCNAISNDELIEAERLLMTKHQPVCIYKEGISVLDDVGGLSGFANFLGTIYEGKDKEEASDARTWARSLGWSARKTSNMTLL